LSEKTYSQGQALWAITRASFKAIFSMPTAVFFSLLFPIIFILIFGAFGNRGGPSYRIAIDPASDTTSRLYTMIASHPSIKIVSYPDTVAVNKDLLRGRLTAVVMVQSVATSGRADTASPEYVIRVRSTTASNNTIPAFMETLDHMKLRFERRATPGAGDYIAIEKPQIANVRPYRQIDFILPGQLGFSILFSTLFGIAFTFYGLREQLVLKRFYASPVNKINILLGIGMSRLFFQLMNVIVLIVFGHYLLNFTLQNGFITVLEMVVMTIIMLFLLMGVGLIFSSIVKSDTSIPLWINLFGFPQMMLSGTFFSIEVFPKWLQEICKILPLTQFNDSMRKIAFEGLHITDCWRELGILAIWMVVIYVILSRVLKWE
jgi:ABC-2 type transport system permease protein